MGVTFIGNPLDQDNDYYDSDWEVNLDEEWVTAPQLVNVLDRAQFNLILAAGAESSGDESDPNWQESNNDDDSDEDYNPEDGYGFNSEPDDTDDSEAIDYVTYPLNDSAEADKTTPDTSSNRENNDTD